MAKHQRKAQKGFLYFFAVFVSAAVFLSACVIAVREFHSYRSSLELTEKPGASSSRSASGGSPSSGTVSSEGASSAAANGSAADRNLILVNYDHKLPDWFQPDLVTVYGVKMDRHAAAAYEKMSAAAATDGISLWISSAYRSSGRQEELFNREIAGYAAAYSSSGEAEAYAEKSVARPGYSEHSTGLAMDLNGVKDDFDTTPAFRWLSGHAQEYGFILRYPRDKQSITKIKYEPWHYRYVGVENAKAMKEKGFCLEEYLDFLQKKGTVH